jgi:hypothetical protein
MIHYAAIGAFGAAKLAVGAAAKAAVAAHHVLAAHAVQSAAVAGGGLATAAVLDYGYLTGWFTEQEQSITVGDTVKMALAGMIENGQFKRIPLGQTPSAVMQAITTQDGKQVLASRVIKPKSIAQPLAEALAIGGALAFE